MGQKIKDVYIDEPNLTIICNENTTFTIGLADNAKCEIAIFGQNNPRYSPKKQCARVIDKPLKFDVTPIVDNDENIPEGIKGCSEINIYVDSGVNAFKAARAIDYGTECIKVFGQVSIYVLMKEIIREIGRTRMSDYFDYETVDAIFTSHGWNDLKTFEPRVEEVTDDNSHCIKIILPPTDY